jgi:hypothetical protein
VPIGGLDELDFAEGPLLDEVEHEGVDLWPHWLHDVESKRLASARVRVDDPKTWVEPNGLASQDRFYFHQRVDVV